MKKKHYKAVIDQLIGTINEVLDIHYNKDGKCMGCPKSMYKGGTIYADYPCQIVKILMPSMGGE